MQLKPYLDQHGISYTAFAKDLGVSAEAVRRYATEGRVPAPDLMPRIYALTDGAVQPNDFFVLPDISGQQGRPAA